MTNRSQRPRLNSPFYKVKEFNRENKPLFHRAKAGYLPARPMTTLDALERRFGHLAIPGLIRIVALLNALIYLIGAVDPRSLELFVFNREAILQGGQYWRLVTFLFIPQAQGIFILLTLWFLWGIGGALEMVWGTFRLNLFYFTGCLLTIGAALLVGQAYSNIALNLSLLFVFARFFPNQMMAFPPIPVKWAAWIFGGFALMGMLSDDRAYQGAVIAMIITYLLFFGPETIRNRRQERTARHRREKFEAAAALPADTAMHTCATCGRTEISHPALDFRVSRDGNEYCTEHLPPKPTA